MLIDFFINLIITIYFYLFLFLAAIINTILAIPLKLFSLKCNLVHLLLVQTGKFLLFISGCRIQIKKEFIPLQEKNYLIISNHQSMFDILVINKILGNMEYRWIVKSSLFKLPFLGILMYLAGYISVDRKNKYKAYKSIQRAIKILRENSSIFIFPEGTRSTRDEILPFKSGSIKIAFSTGADILPVVLKNTLYVKPRKSFMVNPMPIKAKILKPVKIKGKHYSSQRKILNALHQKVSNVYKNEMS